MDTKSHLLNKINGLVFVDLKWLKQPNSYLKEKYLKAGSIK